MSNMTQQFDSDLAAVETELPVTFIWNGKEYTGSKNVVPDSIELQDAGFIPKTNFELLARTAIFGDEGRPQKEDEFRIGQKDFRIESLNTSQDDESIILTLGALT